MVKFKYNKWMTLSGFCIALIAGPAENSAMAQSSGGTSANSCISLEQNSYGSPILQNNCAHMVSVAWCVESPYTQCRTYNNMLNIKAGGIYPVGGKGRTHWGACRGRDTIDPNSDSKKFDCRPE